jgi:hypothetical protein
VVFGSWSAATQRPPSAAADAVSLAPTVALDLRVVVAPGAFPPRVYVDSAAGPRSLTVTSPLFFLVRTRRMTARQQRQDARALEAVENLTEPDLARPSPVGAEPEDAQGVIDLTGVEVPPTADEAGGTAIRHLRGPVGGQLPTYRRRAPSQQRRRAPTFGHRYQSALIPTGRSN